MKDDGFSEHQPERDIVDIEVEEYCEGIPGKLEKQLFALFYKKRFLDLIHNFVIFDKGIKKGLVRLADVGVMAIRQCAIKSHRQ